jgi:small subunit ribosomal protein S20e
MSGTFSSIGVIISRRAEQVKPNFQAAIQALHLIPHNWIEIQHRTLARTHERFFFPQPSSRYRVQTHRPRYATSAKHVARPLRSYSTKKLTLKLAVAIAHPKTTANMSTYDAKKVQQGEMAKIHKIRITLTSRKVSSLEKVCQELIDRSKSKDLRVKGPVRMPTKNLKISTRKTPCGEGSKTWDTYEMR